MPAIPARSKILVTGANGFVASALIRELLNTGYQVTGTVRTKEKGVYLGNLFNGLPFEYSVVEDISKAGAFDEAITGVDAIVHAASPIKPTDYPGVQAYLDVAVNSTKELLISAKSESSIKRVILISSIAAVYSILTALKGHTFTESDWNDQDVEIVQQKGNDAPGGSVYGASKTLAERALWEFCRDESLTFDAVAICPDRVFGSFIHELHGPETLNSWASHLYPWANGEKGEDDIEPSPEGFVNVKDVASGVPKALSIQAAGGERFILCGGVISEQDYCDVLHDRFPDLQGVPIGRSGKHDEIVQGANIDSGEKAAKVLGVAYTGWEDTITETVQCLRDRLYF